jgi:hypothetical protein
VVVRQLDPCYSVKLKRIAWRCLKAIRLHLLQLDADREHAAAFLREPLRRVAPPLRPGCAIPQNPHAYIDANIVRFINI